MMGGFRVAAMGVVIELERTFDVVILPIKGFYRGVTLKRIVVSQGS